MAMDEQRFDRLARTVGGQRTRREALRWFGGSMAALVALVRGERAVAQGTIQLGGACYDSGQCRSDGSGPVFCADNGYEYDGPLNCCRYEGGFCGENHENCCGQLECWNGGYCTDVSGSRSGSSGAGGSYYRGPGEPCQSDDQCRAASGAFYCADNGVYYDGALHCCAFEGDRCGADDHCCGSASCINGICGYYGPGPGYGLPLGASCTDTSQCNGGGYGVLCVGSYTLPGMTCCLMNGQGCAFDGDCCGSDLCMFQDRRIGSTCAQYYGGECNSDLGCGRGLTCYRGYCQ